MGRLSRKQLKKAPQCPVIIPHFNTQHIVLGDWATTTEPGCIWKTGAVCCRAIWYTSPTPPPSEYLLHKGKRTVLFKPPFLFWVRRKLVLLYAVECDPIKIHYDVGRFNNRKSFHKINHTTRYKNGRMIISMCVDNTFDGI